MELSSAMSGSLVSFFLVAVLVVRAPLPSSAVSVAGKVSCMDCVRGANLTGIGLAVKCDNSTRLSFVTTDITGHFSAELPMPVSDSTTTTNTPSCAVALVGGNRQLCAYRKSITSQVIKAQAGGGHPRASYTISHPLSFFTSCSRFRRGNGGNAAGEVAGSKTVDVPFPPEWGLAPSSYYLFPFNPFFAIFSIP